MSLFTTCPRCQSNTTASLSTLGSLLRVNQSCSACLYQFTWNSQPIVQNLPVGSLLISASLLLSGLLPQKTFRFFNFMNCATISKTAFFRHQKCFVQPAVSYVWRQNQSKIFSAIKSSKRNLSVGGDGRCDSPGYCAKYGAYTIMDLEQNQILDMQLVQVKFNIICTVHC